MNKLFRFLAVWALLAALCLGGIPAAAMEQEDGWVEDPEAVTDYAFSFAFVGDTQIIARYYPEHMHKIYDWILQEKEARNIRVVVGLGDITDTSEGEEWMTATQEILRLSGELPYILSRGNHDDPYSYTAYIDDSDYRKMMTGFYKEDIHNTYLTLTVGTIDYLILSLDFGPSDKTLLWASNVVQAHPFHNVIVVTHGYMDSKGVLLTPRTSPYAPSTLGGINDGPAIWEQLVRKHENIIMVVCGHISHPVIAVHEATGDHGNKIQQVLIDPQEQDRLVGPGGNVAMFHFSADGKTVQIENFATIPGKRYGSNLTFEVACLGGNALARREGGVYIDPAAPEAASAMDSKEESKTLSPVIIALIVVMTLAEVALVVYLVPQLRKKK